MKNSTKYFLKSLAAWAVFIAGAIAYNQCGYENGYDDALEGATKAAKEHGHDIEFIKIKKRKEK